MRVRFGELSATEAGERQRFRANAREAWQHLRAGNQGLASTLMSGIDERLELSLSDDGAGSLCAELTALEPCAWPLAELLLAEAPSDLGFTLSLGRAASSLESALAEVRESHGVELERATFRAGFSRGHLLEITLAVPGGTGSENEQNAAENLVRAVLGDRVFETWIGAVDVTAAPRGGSLRVLDTTAPRSQLYLPELYATIAAATLGVLRGLPDAHSAASSDAAQQLLSSSRESERTFDDEELDLDQARGDWTLLEVEPIDDESGLRKDDLVLAGTCTPELLRCYLDGSPCASRRFSRTGEQFVFVRYEDDAGRPERRVAKRSVIETALSEAVAGVGAITGVGLGVKTTYIDLALCNLETGLPRVIAKLRDVGVPPRSFIQFFDSELADEWLSIQPDIRLTEE